MTRLRAKDKDQICGIINLEGPAKTGSSELHHKLPMTCLRAKVKDQICGIINLVRPAKTGSGELQHIERSHKDPLIDS